MIIVYYCSSIIMTTPACACFPPGFICPLTLSVIKEPIMAQWGHHFERAAILKWPQLHDVCPMTRSYMSLKDILSTEVFKRGNKPGREEELDKKNTKMNLVTKGYPLFCKSSLGRL
jgi:hypothetical protein